MNITSYSATSRGSMLSTLKKIILDFPQAHQIAIRLFKRDVKARYRRSLLGFFWAVFPPMLTAGLWIFLKNNKVADFGETAIPYPIYVFTGTMLWQIFTEAFNKPLQIISANKSIMVKINIPTEGLILSGLYDTIFKTIINVGLLIITFLVFRMSPSWTLALFPIGVAGLILAGFTFGIFVVPLGMLYDDVRHIIGIGLPFLMYLTPVVYPMPKNGLIGQFMQYNPLAILINTTRDMFAGQPLESSDLFTLFMFIFLFALLIGIVILKKSVPIIIERNS